MEEEMDRKTERLEDALLGYIERHAENTQPEIAATIPAVASVLVEMWEKIDFTCRPSAPSVKEGVEQGISLALHQPSQVK